MGTCDSGTRDEGLGDIKYAGTCGTGTWDVKYSDAADSGTLMNIVKVGGECDISVLFMGNIRFHRPEPHRTPFDVYTKYFLVNISLFANKGRT